MMVDILKGAATASGGELSQDAKNFFSYIETKLRPFQPSTFDKIAHGISTAIYGASLPVFSPQAPVKVSWAIKALYFTKRVHANPFIGSAWVGNSDVDLTKTGFVEWSIERAEKLMKHRGCYPDFEYALAGRKHSKIRLNALSNPTSVTWLRQMSIFSMFYVHYDCTDYLGRDWPEPRRITEDWIEATTASATGPTGALGTKDHRMKAFPNPASGDLDQFYFESEDEWRRLLNIKRKVDPNDVFTPNLFCIGAGTRREERAQTASRRSRMLCVYVCV